MAVNSSALDRSDHDDMIRRLGELCRDRYHSALSEGMSERAAFEEIVETILKTYAEAVAS